MADGYLSGLAQIASKAPSGSGADPGRSAVSGTLAQMVGPQAQQQSDPIGQLVQMRQIAQSTSAPTLAQSVQGSGLLAGPPPSSGSQPATTGGAATTFSPISSAYNGGNINSPTDFADALLTGLHDKITPQDVQSIVNWEGREGGNWNNTATANPLNTTQAYDGSHVMSGGNTAGVQAYKNWLDGLNATIQTLDNGRYGDILGALASGGGLQGHLSGLGSWSGGGYYSI